MFNSRPMSLEPGWHILLDLVGERQRIWSGALLFDVQGRPI